MKHKAVFAVAPAAMVLIGAVPAFAVEDSSTISAALGTAFTGLKTDFMAAVVVALPIGLAIFGVIFTIRKVKAAFNTIAK